MPRARTTANAKSLARPGDPLVTERGIAIAPERLDDESRPQDDVVSAKTFKPQKQRAAKDLPAEPPMMKAVACIFMFNMLGVADRETAEVLGITNGDLKAVKNSPVYTECFQEVLQELISANSEMLQARVAAYAGDAVDNIMTIARGAKKDETRLAANRDIADRAGVGVKNGLVINSTANELRIQVVDGGKTADINLRQ
jgi:hypothetical protein